VRLGQIWKARPHGRISPTRQVLRQSGHSDRLGTKVLWQQKGWQVHADNPWPDYGRAGCHGVDYIQVCSSRAKLWKKRRLIQSFENRRNESLPQFS